jgi:hypothetical protein
MRWAQQPACCPAFCCKISGGLQRGPRLQLNLNVPFRFDPAEVGASVVTQRLFRVEDVPPVFIADEDDPMPESAPFLDMPLDREEREIGKRIP